MAKKITTITVLVLSILLISLLVIRTTYSLIINVIEKDGKNEIVNQITIRDLVTDDNGIYTTVYYDVLKELDITSDEANILIDSDELNRVLNILLNSVVDYRLNNKNKLSNDEIIDLITSSVNSDNTINNELKAKVIYKTNQFITDISDYLYDLKTSKDVNKV